MSSNIATANLSNNPSLGNAPITLLFYLFSPLKSVWKIVQFQCRKDRKIDSYHGGLQYLSVLALKSIRQLTDGLENAILHSVSE